MDRFVSHHVSRLDAKGRVSIPASFRSVLARDGFEGLCAYPSLDAQTLDCGGHALMAGIDGLLERFSPFSPERDTYSTALLGTLEILKIDPEGRIALTDTLKGYSGISSELVFVGQGYKFQIWEPGRFRTHLEEARGRVRTLRQMLSNQHATRGPTPAAPHGARE